MKHKCVKCNKQYKNMIQHLSRSQCGSVAVNENVASLPVDVDIQPTSSLFTDSKVTDYNLHALAEDVMDMAHDDSQDKKQN